MLSLTKEERLVLMCLGVVVVMGVSTNYLLKVSPLARDFLNITNNYERHLRFDINKVSYDELLAIPQIGPQLAKRIISYREQSGPLRHLDELQKISGVGHLKFKMIKKYLIVAP
jgi:competence ComEA-like helix-hairpin-helix protein